MDSKHTHLLFLGGYSQYSVSGLLILFQRLGWYTRVPLVLSEGFDIVEVGNDIFKKIGRANFEI